MGKQLFEDEQLQPLIEVVWTTPERGEALLQELPSTYLQVPLSHLSAPVKLLQFMLNTLLQQFDPFDFEQKELQSFFEQHKNEQGLAMLHAWRMYAYITIGNLNEAARIYNSFDTLYSADNCPEAFACFYTFSCFYADKNGYFEDYIRFAHEVEQLLRKTRFSQSWKVALRSLVSLFRSRAYSNYHRFNEVLPLIEQIQNAINEHRLSVFISSQLLSAQTFFYDLNGDREKAIATMYANAELVGKNQNFNVTHYTAISNILHLLNLKNRKLPKGTEEYIENKRQQLKCLQEAETLVRKNYTTAATGFFYYAKSWFLIQENKLEEALSATAKSILIFYRLYQYRFLAQSYTAAYHIYKQKAVATKSYSCAYKAARSSEQMRLMSDLYYKNLLKERIQTLETQFQLKERQLSEKIMQHELEARNKEILHVSLHLHEKIMTLNNLKEHILSLNAKTSGAKELIKSISKAIDAVKITEGEKAVLQQKMMEGNTTLTKELMSRYTSLSAMEIRMCVLFQTGISNKELSKLYGLSEKAYEQQRYRIKKKMGLSNTQSLVKHLVALSATPSPS